MRTLRSIAFTTYVTVFICCNHSVNQVEKDTTAIKHPQPKSDSIAIREKRGALTLNHFRNIPKEVDGCSCLFSGSEEKFKASEYLFAGDNNKIAFISVGNSLVKLQLVSTTVKEGTFGAGDHTSIYRSDDYKVTVERKFKDMIAEEVWWNDGIITIERKDGEEATLKFVGECGC